MKGIDELQKKLEEARQLFLQPGNQDDGVANDKAGAVACIEAVSDFLKAQGIVPSLLRPLREITGAFADTEVGGAPHLFRRRPLKGRPPLSRDRAALMATAATAATLLMAADKSELSACETVANKLTAAGFKIGTPQNQGTAGESFMWAREKVIDGRLGAQAATIYRDLMDFTAAMNPKEAADTLLSGLSTLHSEKA